MQSYFKARTRRPFGGRWNDGRNPEFLICKLAAAPSRSTHSTPRCDPLQEHHQASPSKHLTMKSGNAERSSHGRRRWPARPALLLAVTATATLLSPHGVVAAQHSSSSSQTENCEAERGDCQDDATCLECYSGITPATRDAWETCISSVVTDDPCLANGTLFI